MKRSRSAIVGLGLFLVAALAASATPDMRQARRDAIDLMAQQTVLRLCEGDVQAQQLYGKAVGYAVFDSFKAGFLLSGGGGVGVAVDKQTGRRTYMRMGTGGLGLGLGGHSFQVVFFFEDPEMLQRFVTKGWQADASATAVAGTSGANAPATFSHGLSVFHLTNKGLMAMADVSGTKYWRSGKLNDSPTARRTSSAPGDSQARRPAANR